MNITAKYIHKIKRNCTNPGDSEEDLIFWRNKLFATTIIYLLPLSLIALIPGIYWSLKINLYVLALIDIITVLCMIIVGFLPQIKLIFRKAILISCAYLFSIAILYYVGLNGPGLLYLLTTCIFSILIFSTDRVYWSAWLNTFICVIFALLVQYNMLPQGDLRNHNIGEWIAVSTNLIFLSFLCVALIPLLFKGLQKTITKERKWKKELEIEKQALFEVSAALRQALNENIKTMDSSLDVICAVDAKGVFLRVSAACEEMWGYRADELIGNRTIDFVYPEDRIKTQKAADNVLAGKNAVNFENRYVHKNGSIVPISWSVRWDEKDQIRYAVARNVSEKKKLEKAVEFERQRFYDLFLEAPVSIGVVSGPDHVYEVVNPQYLELIGINDIIGKSVKDVLPGTVEQGFICILDKVYKTGETFSANEMLVKLDIGGKLRDKYLNFSYQAHRDNNQEIDGIFFFAVDVTEQVLSRKRIEVSELRLKESQRIAHLGSWEIDMKSQTHTWSDEIYKLLGVERAEVIPTQEAFLSFIHPDDLEYVTNEMEHALKSHADYSFDFRFITREGLTRYGNSLKLSDFDTNLNPIRVYGIVQDITERKEVEQQLRNSESFNRGVLDSLNSNIAVINFTGTLVAVNESWNIFGFENGAHTTTCTGIGSNYFEVCSKAEKDGEEYAGTACAGIKDVMNDREDIFYLEYPCDSPEGKRWFGMRALKFEGNQSLVVVSHQDISERKFAEFERSRVAKDLIQRNNDLEQFAYIISHNLRAPVANILGLISIQNIPDLSQEEKEELNQGLFESVDKLDDIVKDLNQILQVSTTLNENKEQVNFSKLVEDIKISIKNLIELKRIEIGYDFSEINTFTTLKSYIYSIFYNLITNSIKYRQPQIPCIINIESHLVDRKLQLIFTDNGLGIDLERQGDQVFGLYKRFHPSVEGKGLGLFMVKAQVEKLGGKISIRSEVNKGSQFTIEFDWDNK
ncbi:MAG: PAS domain S-box protein [Daejeonella sp.]|uniref:PAS domain-containing sensor histidine kinase n=1 Tax=Daejeonella sp. TaxID=2805397 RepID=UPI002732CFBC|nr:PAS domain S-box protein [Daejeonella sp.]MDP3467951.1 PAS domain S-box protein [Daejeonella sp.]